MPVARGPDDSCEHSSDLPPIGLSDRRFRPSFNRSVRRSQDLVGGPADCRNVRPLLHRSQAPKPQHLVVSRTGEPLYLDERRVWWRSAVNRWIGWGRPVEVVWITPRPTPRRARVAAMFGRTRGSAQASISYARSIIAGWEAVEKWRAAWTLSVAAVLSAVGRPRTPSCPPLAGRERRRPCRRGPAANAVDRAVVSLYVWGRCCGRVSPRGEGGASQCCPRLAPTATGPAVVGVCGCRGASERRIRATTRATARAARATSTARAAHGPAGLAT
jgi:hypothetical protein